MKFMGEIEGSLDDSIFFAIGLLHKTCSAWLCKLSVITYSVESPCSNLK